MGTEADLGAMLIVEFLLGYSCAGVFEARLV